MSMNDVFLSGRLTADPVVRVTQSNKSVASFCLAVERPKAKDQEKADADFIDCVAWEGWADAVERNAVKGSRATVRGRLSTRTYQDKQGNNRKAVEVVCSYIEFAEYKKKARDTVAPASQSIYPENMGNTMDEIDDDLPF